VYVTIAIAVVAMTMGMVMAGGGRGLVGEVKATDTTMRESSAAQSLIIKWKEF